MSSVPTRSEAYFAARSMQTLELLAFGPSTATQLATRLQVHPRTARRMLNRLVADGWLVRRDGPRPTYSPTMRIVALAAQFVDREPLVRCATELAGPLREATGADVHLAVPSYRSALRLVRAAGSEPACARRDLAPAHATAAGKALLAGRLPWRDAVLGVPLAPVTTRTRVTAPDLAAELDTVAADGYATEDEEYRAGSRAVAVPVTRAGETVAALALSSPTLSLAALVERLAAATAAAAALSDRVVGDR